MNLDGRQAQLAHNVRILDGQGLLNRLAFQPLRGEARARNRRPTAERLELGIVDDTSVRIDFDLQLHHVAALRSADQPRTNVRIVFRQRPDVAGMFVVIDYLVRVSHLFLFSWGSPRSVPTPTFVLECFSALPTALSRGRPLLSPAHTAGTSHGGA